MASPTGSCVNKKRRISAFRLLRVPPYGSIFSFCFDQPTMSSSPSVEFRGQWPPGEQEVVETAVREAEDAGLTSGSSELVAPWVAARQVLDTKSLYMASWQGADSGLLAKSATGLADRIRDVAEGELGVPVGTGEAGSRPSNDVSLVQLVYESEAVAPMSKDEIRGLLQNARSKNERLNVTGLLLHAKGQFLQVLEGPDMVVGDLYETIREDPRHTSVDTIFVTSIARRTFPDWRMGLECARTAAGEEGTSDFLQTGTLRGAVEPFGGLLEALQRFKQRGSPVWKDVDDSA